MERTRRYDPAEFIQAQDRLEILPRVTQKCARPTFGDGRCGRGQRGWGDLSAQKRVARVGIWLDQVIRPYPTGEVHGLEKVDHVLVLNMAAYNVMQMRTPRQLRLPTRATARRHSLDEVGAGREPVGDVDADDDPLLRGLVQEPLEEAGSRPFFPAARHAWPCAAPPRRHPSLRVRVF